ncbi:MAG: hypothetical protein KBB38_11620, partial [Bacteroidia bacterium]|nr:hypothetical protein [Bacteroidia bacterium]
TASAIIATTPAINTTITGSITVARFFAITDVSRSYCLATTEHGGEVIYSGPAKKLVDAPRSVTGDYIAGRRKIEVPQSRRKVRKTKQLRVVGARENNLKDLTVNFPLGVFTCVTGVSGSGKSTLVNQILYPVLADKLNGARIVPGKHTRVEGVGQCDKVIHVDQNPIGKSSRSNPVTYVKAYDEIRALYADLPLSRARKYKPAHFSFNVEGGRCEVCEGEGQVTIEMQFMADIHLVCENCGGKRFKQEILDVSYKGKNVAELLDMTVDEAIEFFSSPIKSFGNDGKIATKLKPLQDVGLGYVKLGQSSSTLSGGEAQRIKLASFLGKGNSHDHTLFIFDEPTTGLHFHDIRKLLLAFDMLLEQGNSLIIIEHNPDVIKCADWVIDMGPEGGVNGGQVVFEGTPDELAKAEGNHTGHFLRDKL